MRRRLASRVPCFRLWRSCRRPRCARRLLPTRRLPRLPRHRPQLPTLAMRSRLPGPPPLLPLPPQPQQLMPGKRTAPHLLRQRRSQSRFESQFEAIFYGQSLLANRTRQPSRISPREVRKPDEPAKKKRPDPPTGGLDFQQLSNLVASQWICSVAMRRATMKSKAPLSTCNLSPLQGPLLPCRMRRRSSRQPAFPQDSSPAGATSLRLAKLALRSRSRTFRLASELWTVSNPRQTHAAKSVQPSALCYARSSRKVRVPGCRRYTRRKLMLRSPGQRSTGGSVPVRRAGEAMLPPQLRGRHVSSTPLVF